MSKVEIFSGILVFRKMKRRCVSLFLAFKVIKAYFSMLVFFFFVRRFFLSLIHSWASIERERKKGEKNASCILSFSYFLLQAAESVCLCWRKEKEDRRRPRETDIEKSTTVVNRWCMYEGVCDFQIFISMTMIHSFREFNLSWFNWNNTIK